MATAGKTHQANILCCICDTHIRIVKSQKATQHPVYIVHVHQQLDRASCQSRNSTHVSQYIIVVIRFVEARQRQGKHSTKTSTVSERTNGSYGGTVVNVEIGPFYTPAAM